MFGLDYGEESRRVSKAVAEGAKSRMSLERFLEKEIERFLSSAVRRDMLTGDRYYKGEHDILKRKRRVIAQDGELTEVNNLPNNRIVDNQYARLVNQKNNYLLSKAVSISCADKEYRRKINRVLDKNFWRKVKNIGEDSLNCGIGWLYVYYDNGELAFKRIRPSEILPFWADEEHTKLDMAVRVYEIEGYEGEREVTITKAEVYKKEGMERYTIEGGRLIKEQDSSAPYITDGEGKSLSWNRVPLIAFKQNNKEIPLIKRVKCLQDSLNEVRNDFINNMQEDARNTILVLKNYDGTNLGEFRKNLSEYGVVKVKTVDGADGGVEALKIDIDSSNYIALGDMLKKAIVENAHGYDSRDERMSNNPNELNIKSMYSDIDLDACGMESEFAYGVQQVIWFINEDLKIKGIGDYSDEEVKIIFNKDQLINESEVIDNCNKSVGLLSRETVVANHPWSEEVEREV